MKVVVAAGLVVWLASLPFLSHARAETWTDEEGLWASAQRWSPAKLRPTVELGRLQHLAGRWDEAERSYRRAIGLWSIDRPAHEVVGCGIAVHNLMVLLEQQSRTPEAEAWGRYSCERQP